MIWFLQVKLQKYFFVVFFQIQCYRCPIELFKYTRPCLVSALNRVSQSSPFLPLSFAYDHIWSICSLIFFVIEFLITSPKFHLSRTLFHEIRMQV